MNKKSILSFVLAVVLALGLLAGCADNTPTNVVDPGQQGPASYTVTFDVGAEATAAGVSTPSKQVVKSGSTAVEPVIDYWAAHELIGWYNGGTQWSFSTDTVTSDITLEAQWRTVQSADVAATYEKNLIWGEEGHLYVHYLRGAHSESEEGTYNTSAAPDYSGQIDSAVYGDWGLWVWEYFPTNSEGRAFYPAWIDESGAVYDIDLTATYSDAGWNETTRENKGIQIDYKSALRLGIQVFSQDSRENGEGFWVNDGGDVYIILADMLREGGDYHWFIVQGDVPNGSATFESYVVYDPYAGIEYGSATTELMGGYDVISNRGNNSTYAQQDVAEGWEDNSVGYQIFIASFADSDGDGMGDLQGIISKLDYLDDLGVDTLWLTPFQQSNSYHGYDVRDYFTVDPRFGTLDDYRELLYEAHQRGMKVLLDFVLNHTSTSNPWFEKSINMVEETVQMPDGSYKVINYRNFYTWQSEDYYNSITDPNEKVQWFRDANGYYYYSSFGSSMPELNFDYQAVRDAILQVALYWMSFGLDGFRLDAVKHIYMENENPNSSSQIIKDISESGDYSFDVKKNENFFMEFNAKLKASYPGALLVGENLNGDPIKIGALYGGMDSQFNFNWYYDTTGALGTIAQADSITLASGMNVQTTQYQYASKIMNQYAAAQFDFNLYRSDYIDSNFTSNHDVQRARERVLATYDNTAADWIGNGVRVGTEYEQADVQLSGELAKLWGAMCMSVPGITWIYNGDELGMFGTKKDNPVEEGTGHEDRWYRQPMKWTKDLEDDSANCYYPIGFNNYMMTWDSLNMELDGVAEQKDDTNSIYNVYKQMIALRQQYKALSRGTITNTTKSYSNGQGTYIISWEISDGTDTFEIFVNAAQSAHPFYSTAKPTGTLVYTTNSEYTGDTTTMTALTFAIFKK